MSDHPRLYSDVLGYIQGLRYGITTGTCAQAAAKAAAHLLVSGEQVDTVSITLPRGKSPFAGKRIAVPLEFCRKEQNSASSGSSKSEAAAHNGLADHNTRVVAVAGVRKDAGDDRDETHGLVIVCRARFTDKPGVTLLGGKGVGVVTRKGLAVPVGEAAINSVPRRAIVQEVGQLLPAGRGIELTIEAPGGDEVASRTWNPRLGIEGGISIIGTSGVVTPRSSRGFKSSMAVVIKAAVTQGRDKLILTPGYVGERFLSEKLDVPDEYIVTVGDHIGFGLRNCRKRGCKRVMLVGHIGKMVKIAAGLFNTHSKYGDARLETIAACAAAAGAAPELVSRILSLRLAEAAVPLLQEAGLEETFSLIAERAIRRSMEYTEDELDIGCILLTLESEILMSQPRDFTEEKGWKRYLL